MLTNFLNDPTRAILRKAMDACAERNSVIAQNVANADTPGYKRSYVRFEEMLQQMLAEGTPEIDETNRLKPIVQQDNTPSGRLDGNNVNIDTEMADLARTQIEYNAMIDLNRMKGQMIRTVISGGTK